LKKEKALAKNKKRLLSILAAVLIAVQLPAQARSGMENYHQLGEERSYLWIPMLHYSSAKGYYAELRYNYEDAGTFSIFAGKSFKLNRNKVSGTLTPMLGYSAGNFQGLSIGLNTEISSGRFYFSSQMQYSHALVSDQEGFYFNWSEAGYDLSERIYAGLAFQYTLQAAVGDFEPGIVVGLNAGDFSFPVYLFRPFGKGQTVMAGLNYEFRLSGKKKNKSLSL